MDRSEYIRAHDLKTKHLMCVCDIGTQINFWLDENPDAKVLDIQFSTIDPVNYARFHALIIYRAN